MSDLVEVHITATDADTAERLATLLIEGRYTACVQTLPVRSIYRWAGAVERAAEYLLLAKTTSDTFPALAEAITAAHPYEVPEIIAVPVTATDAYAAWVRAEVAD